MGGGRRGHDQYLSPVTWVLIPRYSWNIVESGVKHHKLKLNHQTGMLSNQVHVNGEKVLRWLYFCTQMHNYLKSVINSEVYIDYWLDGTVQKIRIQGNRKIPIRGNRTNINNLDRPSNIGETQDQLQSE